MSVRTELKAGNINMSKLWIRKLTKSQFFLISAVISEHDPKLEHEILEASVKLRRDIYLLEE